MERSSLKKWISTSNHLLHHYKHFMSVPTFILYQTAKRSGACVALILRRWWYGRLSLLLVSFRSFLKIFARNNICIYFRFSQINSQIFKSASHLSVFYKTASSPGNKSKKNYINITQSPITLTESVGYTFASQIKTTDTNENLVSLLLILSLHHAIKREFNLSLTKELSINSTFVG